MRYLLLVILVSLIVASTILSIALYVGYMQQREILYSSRESITPLIGEEITKNHGLSIINNTINEILDLPSMKTIGHNNNLAIDLSITLSLQPLTTQSGKSIPGNITYKGYVMIGEHKEYFKLNVNTTFEKDYEVSPSSRIIIVISNATNSKYLEGIALRYNIAVSLRIKESSLKTAFMNALTYTIALILSLITTLVISRRWLKIKTIPH